MLYYITLLNITLCDIVLYYILSIALLYCVLFVISYFKNNKDFKHKVFTGFSLSFLIPTITKISKLGRRSKDF